MYILHVPTYYTYAVPVCTFLTFQSVGVELTGWQPIGAGRRIGFHNHFLSITPILSSVVALKHTGCSTINNADSAAGGARLIITSTTTATIIYWPTLFGLFRDILKKKTSRKPLYCRLKFYQSLYFIMSMKKKKKKVHSVSRSFDENRKVFTLKKNLSKLRFEIKMILQ